jgi:hypothetical protein
VIQGPVTDKVTFLGMFTYMCRANCNFYLLVCTNVNISKITKIVIMKFHIGEPYQKWWSLVNFHIHWANLVSMVDTLCADDEFNSPNISCSRECFA